MEGYTVGEFARQVGMSADTLKHYEKLGLISFRRNEENGYRYCDFSQCEDLFFIRSCVTGRLGLQTEYIGTPSDENRLMEALSLVEREAERRLALDRASRNKARELRDVYESLSRGVQPTGASAKGRETLLHGYGERGRVHGALEGRARLLWQMA